MNSWAETIVGYLTRKLTRKLENFFGICKRNSFTHLTEQLPYLVFSLVSLPCFVNQHVTGFGWVRFGGSKTSNVDFRSDTRTKWKGRLHEKTPETNNDFRKLKMLINAFWCLRWCFQMSNDLTKQNRKKAVNLTLDMLVYII